jgi:hypothetical protein
MYFLKLKAVGFYKMLVKIYKTTQCHDPEGHNFNFHHHENLKFQASTAQQKQMVLG